MISDADKVAALVFAIADSVNTIDTTKPMTSALIIVRSKLMGAFVNTMGVEEAFKIMNILQKGNGNVGCDHQTI